MRGKVETTIGEGSRVEVKPLEWGADRKTEDDGIAADAYCSVGHYIASESGWFINGQTQWQPAQEFSASKAACQADYEQRIRSALRSPPEPVAELIEDLNGHADYMEQGGLVMRHTTADLCRRAATVLAAAPPEGRDAPPFPRRRNRYES